MIFALAAVCVALIAVLLVGYRRERALLDEITSLRKDAATERAELLERIQRPERPPAGFQQDYHVPERPPDDWGNVGTSDGSPPRDEIEEPVVDGR